MKRNKSSKNVQQNKLGNKEIINSYRDEEQRKEDEEQAAYLAEWSRRHRKKCQHEKN